MNVDNKANENVQNTSRYVYLPFSVVLGSVIHDSCKEILE